MGTKADNVALSCVAQVGVVERLKASPSICRMARTIMSKLLFGSGVVRARLRLLKYSESEPSSVSLSDASFSWRARFLASALILKARSRSNSSFTTSSSCRVAKISSSSFAAAVSSSANVMGLVALLTLPSSPRVSFLLSIAQYLESIILNAVFCCTIRSLSWFMRYMCSAACCNTDACVDK